MNTTLPQTGEVFDLRYRIAGRLGRGADGYVFGATELETGKRVAIKCWTGAHAEQALAAQQRFIRAAHEARLFENPHIVEVFAAEAGRTVNYCVTEWLEGVTLARYLERVRTAAPNAVFDLVVPCMRAMAEAHTAGIIHGDIRPGHIFVCSATRHRPAVARVFDFGRGFPDLAMLRYVQREQLDEASHYASPELIRGEPLDARTDCYGFGVLLYELLAGERPFTGGTADEIARAIATGTPKLLASLSPSIPSRLASVIERGMALDPAARYASLSEFIDALDVFDPALDCRPVFVSRPGYAASTPHTRSLPPPRVPTAPLYTPSTSSNVDMTTTAASWELTDPVVVNRYRTSLFDRVRPQHVAIACVMLTAAAIGVRYAQLTAAPARDVQAPAAHRTPASPTLPSSPDGPQPLRLPRGAPPVAEDANRGAASRNDPARPTRPTREDGTVVSKGAAQRGGAGSPAAASSSVPHPAAQPPVIPTHSPRVPVGRRRAARPREPIPKRKPAATTRTPPTPPEQPESDTKVIIDPFEPLDRMQLQ